jgi:hypothetical protein
MAASASDWPAAGVPMAPSASMAASATGGSSPKARAISAADALPAYVPAARSAPMRTIGSGSAVRSATTRQAASGLPGHGGGEAAEGQEAHPGVRIPAMVSARSSDSAVGRRKRAWAAAKRRSAST